MAQMLDSSQKRSLYNLMCVYEEFTRDGQSKILQFLIGQLRAEMDADDKAAVEKEFENRKD
jgi:hypothetical protein